MPLIEPEVSETRQIVLGTALRELPVTTVEEAVELTTGVSDGHFRGGRVGQETDLVDGMAIKNQVDAATEGQGMQFSPSALSEIEVITGGFGAEYGSSLSGVVSYTTRRGDPDRWDARVQFLTDRLSPEDASIGQSTLNISAGGPLRFLGEGATLFADLQLQGLQDAEPRARGLTCHGIVLNYPADERDSASISNRAVLEQVLEVPVLLDLLHGESEIDPSPFVE